MNKYQEDAGMALAIALVTTLVVNWLFSPAWWVLGIAFFVTTGLALGQITKTRAESNTAYGKRQ